jgi:uncharacterized protein (DUF1330 family)
MPAYVIVEMTVTDPAGIGEYRRQAEASVAAMGGRFLVRGGKCEVLDGEWKPQRIVVIEFPSLEQAKLWRTSPEYGRACEIRNRAATTQMIAVEGLP